MKITPAPTSGAADLPEAGCSKHHLIHCSQCRHDNMVRDLRAENDRLTTQLAALAAGQATAAPAQPAPATQQAGERVYAFRRKGLADFCTCDEARYEELSNKPHLFETRIFYTAPSP